MGHGWVKGVPWYGPFRELLSSTIQCGLKWAETIQQYSTAGCQIVVLILASKSKRNPCLGHETLKKDHGTSNNHVVGGGRGFFGLNHACCTPVFAWVAETGLGGPGHPQMPQNEQKWAERRPIGRTNGQKWAKMTWRDLQSRPN